MNVRWTVNDLKTVLTASWDTVAGAQGYSFWKDGLRVSYTMDGTRTSTRFGLDGADHAFEVRALGRLDSASTPYPLPAAPPPAVYGKALDAFLAPLPPSDSGHTIEVTSGMSLNAARKTANPGDTLVVRGGTRVEDIEIMHFDPKHPVTIKIAPGEVVTFKGPVHGLYGGDWTGVRLDLRGAVATGCGNDGFKFDNVVDCEILGGESHHNATNGQLVGGQGSSSSAGWTNKLSQRVRLDGMYCHHDGNSDQYHGSYIGGGAAYSKIQAGLDHFLFLNYVCHSIPGGFGAQFGGMATNGIIANCSIDLFGMVKSARGGAPGCYVVYNMADQPWPTHNLLFVNDLATNAPTGGFQGSGSVEMPSNVVRDCMGWKNAQGTYMPIWGTKRVFTQGTNYPDADPMYVTPGSDLHLKAGSPVRGKGDVDYMPPLDRDGKPRTVATLGAYA